MKLIVIILLLLFNQSISVFSESSNDAKLGKKSIKTSIGFDLLTIGYNYQFSNNYFYQLDYNPILNSGALMVGYVTYDGLYWDSYTGVGVGTSKRFTYAYGGIGASVGWGSHHAIFFEGSLAYIYDNDPKDITDYDVDRVNSTSPKNKAYILPLVRFGYKFLLN
jgi:hypothetical protein